MLQGPQEYNVFDLVFSISRNRLLRKAALANAASVWTHIGPNMAHTEAECAQAALISSRISLDTAAASSPKWPLASNDLKLKYMTSVLHAHSKALILKGPKQLWVATRVMREQTTQWGVRIFDTRITNVSHNLNCNHR